MNNERAGALMFAIVFGLPRVRSGLGWSYGRGNVDKAIGRSGFIMFRACGLPQQALSIERDRGIRLLEAHHGIARDPAAPKEAQ